MGLLGGMALAVVVLPAAEDVIVDLRLVTCRGLELREWIVGDGEVAIISWFTFC